MKNLQNSTFVASSPNFFFIVAYCKVVRGGFFKGECSDSSEDSATKNHSEQARPSERHSLPTSALPPFRTSSLIPLSRAKISPERKEVGNLKILQGSNPR